jgi:methyl-accepting chemotaxis protein
VVENTERIERRGWQREWRLSNFKLGTQFTVFLLVVFVGGLIVSGAILYRILEQRAENEVVSKGLILIQTMNSVRNYTSTQVNPLLAPELATADEFIPQSVPAFSAREVFERFRANEQYANFFYKEATLNPTNLRDLADEFETTLVERFRSDSTLREQSGFRTSEGETLFYSARPLAISAESCLACHNTPETAPASLIATYGDEHGFGWTLGEVIAAQIIYVPASDVLNSARSAFTLTMAIVVGTFALALVVINFLVRRSVVQPVEQIGLYAAGLSDGDITQEEVEAEGIQWVAQRGDELGQSARVFLNMARERFAREQSLKQQVQQLRIQIDEAKLNKQVNEIVETDYFQDLQQKAKDIRKIKGGEA